ncbi:N-acetylmuramoyl-L-alanine amidase [Flavobacterium sp. Fl-318]|uniref:N-acetylmuramoyl-L-alanine amidase n=1 Tax=Flavobacterium cupriresistens TaxID=2893885 RepID=A0ABU4RCV1_9FLAO|nr:MULTISPECIES: N-acetylmuramoyl-L-alanine amidase [unclassified Flavobacterium]MDX6189280.1 N-acetylmuramoyl-L-alanine amidase [Flavobacterium sp. Fl-318]UFH41376.1 N-acetylmuramoyl-L-alanine amidase [Flavobacterium sp. F-323]
MEIKKDWLVPDTVTDKIKKLVSPNARYTIVPKFLVIHYTAGDTVESALNWFMTPQDKGNPDRIAAHIVVDVDGSITQLVPFNRRANHAGYSVWDKVSGFNDHSIGIEIVNPGYLEKLTDGSYRRRVGTDKNKKPVYKTYPATIASKLHVGNHKHKFWTDPDNHLWFKFPKAQLDAVYKLSGLLISQYELTTAIGHDDISPARKPDPGPAFPWDDFKIAVFGKTDTVGKIFKVTENGTNFRSGPSKENTPIKSLKKDYEVGLIETNSSWNKVYLVNDKKDVVNSDGGSKKEIGWIHNSLLVLKDI